MPTERDFSATENCVCFNLRWSSRAVTKFFDAELRRHGIRATQSAILLALKAKETWSMSELSEALGIERTTLLRNLRPLQRDGLASSNCSGTGRGARVELSITAKGKKQIEKIMPAWRAAQDTAIQTLGEKRWTAILADLETVAQAMKA